MPAVQEVFVHHPVWNFKELVEGRNSKNLKDIRVMSLHKFRFSSVPGYLHFTNFTKFLDTNRDFNLPVCKPALWSRAETWLKPPPNCQYDDKGHIFLFDIDVILFFYNKFGNSFLENSVLREKTTNTLS